MKIIYPVIPAKAGIRRAFEPVATAVWIPAFAGMTGSLAGMTGGVAGMTGSVAGMTG